MPVVRRIERALGATCAALAALALFAIMLLTLADVSARKALAGSLPGSLELTELLLVVVIFAGLPLVSLQGEHVVFDSLDALLPRWLRRAQGLVVDALCALALAGLAALMWTKGTQMLQYGDTTPQLKLTLGWFVYLMSALLFCCAAVHALLLVAPAAHHPIGVDDEGQR